jgi:hypothetical protein
MGPSQAIFVSNMVTLVTFLGWSNHADCFETFLAPKSSGSIRKIEPAKAFIFMIVSSLQ